MNIAVFHNFPAGGGKRTVYEQVKGLISLGHHLTVFELANPDSAFCDLRPLCPVVVLDFSLQSPLPGPLRRAAADLKNFGHLPLIHRQIASQINRGGFDVALVHPDKYTESPFILRFLTLPHVYHCHELLRIGYEPELAFFDPVSPPKRMYELATRKLRVRLDRTNARSARFIITNSRYIRQKIRSAYGRSAQVCYSGVDPQVFRPRGSKNRQIVFMGQRNLVGGYEFVQQILSRVPKSHRIRLLSFGFPSGRPDTSNDQVLAEAYSSSLATLCVSFSEPFGLKALESMACGTPVLAVAEGGYRESVIHGQTGWLLPRDPGLFAAKICELLDHPRTAVTLGRQARRHILSRWTWTRHVRQLHTILTHVAHG